MQHEMNSKGSPSDISQK